MIETQFDTSTITADQEAVATYSGIWSERLLGPFLELSKTEIPGHLDRVTVQRTRVDEYLAKNFPGGFEKRMPGFGAQLDRVFTTIDWFRNRTPDGMPIKGQGFGDMRYFGVNPYKIEAVWKELWPVTDQYLVQRPPTPDTPSVSEIQFEDRISQAREVIAHIDQRYKGFANQHPDIADEIILTFFQQFPNPKPAEYQKLTSAFNQKAEQQLAGELNKSTAEVPIPFHWVLARERNGVVTPALQDLAHFNRVLLAGQQIDVYCCPDYDREERGDGIKVYGFKEIGTDIGLTAERSFPLVGSLIERITKARELGQTIPPAKMRVGVADFEATDDNAEMVKLAPHQFRQRLGGSVENMVQAISADFHRRNGHGGEISVSRVNSEDEPIGEWQVIIDHQGQRVGELSFGAITQTYVGKVDGYQGWETFQEMVAQKRDELEKKAVVDMSFQEQLHTVLKTRLGVMLNWSEKNQPAALENLASLFKEITDSNFSRPVINYDEFNGLKDRLNPILTDIQIPEGDKNKVCKAIIVNWLKESKFEDDGQRPIWEVLDYLRRKVARQGAEYVVMSDLKRAGGGGGQIIADSATMWQVFGGNSIARLIVTGGYEGA